MGRSYQIFIPNKLDLTFRALNHCVKFHQNQITLEIWAKAQHESARRPKSDWEKLGEGVKEGGISPASKSRGPNSNALAYAERALST